MLSVDHHREGRGLAFGTVEIRVTLETRGVEHMHQIHDALDGYEVSDTHRGRANGSTP